MSVFIQAHAIHHYLSGHYLGLRKEAEGEVGHKRTALLQED